MAITAKAILLALCVALFAHLSVAQPMHVIYAAPPTNPPDPIQDGTVQHPFTTLEMARDYIRTHPARYTANWRVRLKANTQGYRRFYLNQTFVLDPQDSGGPGLQVVYEANPLTATTWDDVLITGGRPVNSTWTHLGSSIWTTTVATAPAAGFRDLYLNNWRLTRARWPNALSDGTPQFTRITYASNYTPWPERWYRIEKSFTPSLGQSETVELVSRLAWIAPRQIPTSIQPNTSGFSTFYFHHTQPIGWSAPCGVNASNMYQVQNLQVRGKNGLDTLATTNPPGQTGALALDGPCNRGTQVYVENSYSFLDQCYEWYFNPVTKQLFVKLPTNVNPNNYSPNSFMYSYVPGLVHLRKVGTDTVRNVFFTRLNFGFSELPTPRINAKPANAPQYDCAGQAWVPQARTGYLPQYSGEGQDPYLYHGLITRAAIHFEETVGCGINHSRIAHVGGSAIAMNGTNNRVMGCKIFDVGGVAIMLGSQGVLSLDEGPELSWTTVGYDNQIRYNTIADYGQVYFDSVAVRVPFQVNANISHNWISRGGYSGISIGACNSTAFCQFGQSGLMIDGNLIEDVCRTMADGAGIYVSNSIGLSTISNNWIRRTRVDALHDYRFFGSAGMYFDEGAVGAWRIGSNIIEETYRACSPCNNTIPSSPQRVPPTYPLFFNVTAADPAQRPDPCVSHAARYDWYASNYSDFTPVRLWSAGGGAWGCDTFGGCIIPNMFSTTDPAHVVAVNNIKALAGVDIGYAIYWPYQAVSSLIEPPGSTTTDLPPVRPSCP